MSILACWKQCSRFLRTEARATILRKRPSIWLPTRPTGLACRLLPTLYSWGATSSMSISTTGMAMFSSPMALTSSSDMIASSSKSRLTTLRTVRSDCPPIPTYTLAIEFFNSPSSLLMIEVKLCAVLSRLNITPLRINVEESSWAYANICMLPSLFFFPATPVIFDEPSSIAAINSVVAISFLFIIFSFRTDNLVAELEVDAWILVPAYLVESFLIEFFQACQFVFKIVQFAEIDKVVAHTWH